jgi:16S rRNA (adenine1518-N6/adenine1519-N6)-dimethyltransferase
MTRPVVDSLEQSGLVFRRGIHTGDTRLRARGRALPSQPTGGTLPRPRKRFGQHFLEPAWVAKLIDAVAPSASDTFLEIGPGRGALTRALAPRVERLIAVEIDRDLAAALPRTVPSNVDVVTGDFLEVDVAALLAREQAPVRVIGNLPYNVSSPILFMLLHAADEGRRFRDATLMLQKEVADRVAARPGSRDYGALAIQVALTARVERILTLPAGAFRPPPKVTSAVVRLTFQRPVVDVGDVDRFERIVRGIFLQRRKTLLNALKPVAETFGRSAVDLLSRAGVDGRQRPEQLGLDELARLSRAVL